MDIFPIWRTVYWESEEDSVRFRIISGAETACEGTASKYPDEDTLKVNLNKPCQAYLDSVIDFSATGDTTSNAYREFALQVKSNNQWITTYEFAFTNDWSYVDHAGDGYSEPINGHSSAGQILVYSVINETTAETICYDNYDNTPHINVTPSAITFDATGGTISVFVYSNYPWRLSRTDTLFQISDTAGTAGGKTIYITAPENKAIETRTGYFEFMAVSTYGNAYATLDITQSEAMPYVNILSGGNQSLPPRASTSWTITYETNLDSVYYVFSGGETGYTNGGTLTISVPSGNTTNYNVKFYSSNGGTLLATANAHRETAYITITSGNGAQIPELGGNWTVGFDTNLQEVYYELTGGVTGITTGHSITLPIGQDYTFYTLKLYAYSGGQVLATAHAERLVDFENMYLTFDIMSGGTILWKASDSAVSGKTIEYNINSEGWHSLTSGMNAFFDVSPGDVVSFRGTDAPYGRFTNTGIAEFYSNKFNSSNVVMNIKGNIMSLVYGDNFIGNDELVGEEGEFINLFSGLKVISAEHLILPATTLKKACYMCLLQSCELLEKAPALPATIAADRCYYGMFRDGCFSLKEPPRMSLTTTAEYCCFQMFRVCHSLEYAPTLPSSSVAAAGCYKEMFVGCDSIITPPALPATNISYECYLDMFEGCTSLASAPALPATTLSQYCYHGMFVNCTSLTSAPELPATTLVNRCYEYMFEGCTSLSYVKCLATTNISGNTENWLDGVSYSGTFEKPASATWAVGQGGIPSNWTVVNL